MTNSNSVSVNLKEYIEQISYKKALTYTKAEVDALIRNGLSDVELVEIVNTLPTGTNIKNNKIYLLNNGKSQTENRFDVYVHTPNNGWEKVDAIDFDITDYYNETQVDNLLAQKAPNNHASTATTYGVSDASKYGHSMATSTSPKMDGTAAVGSETGKFARGDHVHPTDTSRAPNDHASADTTYGAANTVKYGHAMATSTTPKMDGTATMGSETSKFARGDHIHPTDTSRASSTHTHGNITNDGKIGTSTGEIVVTSSGSLTTGNPTTAKIKEASALSNISSSANATQHDVNDKINTTLGNKVDKVSGKGLSTNDFTGAYKTKLDNLETTIANSIGNLDLVEVVTTLPTTNIKDNKLYLKANSVNKNNNKYDIYMYVNNAWEKVDAIDFDLSEYSKTNHTHTSSQITDLASLLDAKTDTEDLSRVAFSGSYLDLSDKPSSHESVYTNMGDVLSSYYIFSKYTEDGDLCLGKLEDIGDIELSVATNAVVTDDEVTYSATVTDIDGDLVPGVYVEFFEDEEIIGTGITNQNGVASYTKVYAESTICDVKAKIGTQEGDITMFVKDKDLIYIFYDIGHLTNHNDNWTSINRMTRLQKYTQIKSSSNTTIRCQAGENLTGSNFTITFKNHNTQNTEDYVIIQHGSSQTVVSFSGASIIGECNVKITFSDGKIYVNVNNGEHIVSVNLKDDLTNGWNFRLGTNPNGSDIYFSELIIIKTQ